MKDLYQTYNTSILYQAELILEQESEKIFICTKDMSSNHGWFSFNPEFQLNSSKRVCVKYPDGRIIMNFVPLKNGAKVSKHKKNVQLDWKAVIGTFVGLFLVIWMGVFTGNIKVINNSLYPTLIVLTILMPFFSGWLLGKIKSEFTD